MAIKKSELYSSLWASCDELRGGMDASQYKDYVLVLLFIKYVSDKYADQPYAPITVRPNSTQEKRQAVLDDWYRSQIKSALQPLIAKWEPMLDVQVSGFTVRRMKSKWGSCTPDLKTIRLNTELAKKPSLCLEYITVHEMVHLLAPTHDDRFVALMDRFMPNWHIYRQALNRLPVRHENWDY